MKVNPPGRLSYVYTPEEISSNAIGTVQFKFVVNDTMDSNSANVSILLFKTKMKISGGVSKHLCQKLQEEKMADNILFTYISEIAEVVAECVQVEINKPEISLINATQKTGQKFENFIKFCEDKFKKNTKYAKTIMPLTNTRGRVGAVKIYPYSMRKSSAHFDQGGKIQYFAFKRIDDMINFSKVLNKELLNK